jgi:glutathione S-transferase
MRRGSSYSGEHMAKKLETAAPEVDVGTRAAERPTGLVGGSGLQLYHYGGSNSSQKVRVCLEEKALAWTSHPVDITAGEQIRPSYLAINPRGQVPALVHDGRVVVESNEIIDYLDRSFPEPPLKPAESMEAELMYRWLELWDTIQPSLRTLSYTRLFAARALEVRDKFASYETALRGNNEELLGFLHEFSSEAGLASTRVAAQEAVDDALARLDVRLRAYEWLAGGAFSLADIAWGVNLNRFELIGFPMEDFDALEDWYAGLRERPSFQRMVIGV